MAEISQCTAAVVGLAGSSAPAAAALCVLAVLCWARSVRSSPPASGQKPQPGLVETGASRSLPEPTDAQLGLDFEAFQASMERECDLALLQLCGAAVDGQVFRGLADYLAGQAPMHSEPPTFYDRGLQANEDDLEILQSDIEQHCDLALDSMLDLTIDGQCDMVLKMLQDECADPGALEDEMMKGVFDLTGKQGTLSRQAEDDSTDKSLSLCKRGTSDKRQLFQEYQEQLLCGPEVVEQPVRRRSLCDMITQHIHRTYSSYWVLAI